MNGKGYRVEPSGEGAKERRRGIVKRKERCDGIVRGRRDGVGLSEEAAMNWGMRGKSEGVEENSVVPWAGMYIGPPLPSQAPVR